MVINMEGAGNGEISFKSHSLLSFSHRGQDVSIPIASSLTDLKELVHAKTLPSLGRLKEIHKATKPEEQIGLALTLYHYPSFDFEHTMPEGATALSDAFASLGYPLPKNSKKGENYEPSKIDLITERNETPEHPFATVENIIEDTLILGPIHVGKPADNFRQAEIDATTASIDGCIAIDGKLVIEWLGSDNGKTYITDGDLVRFVEMLQTPISYALTKSQLNTLSKK